MSVIPLRYVVEHTAEAPKCTEPGCTETHRYKVYTYALTTGEALPDGPQAGDIFYRHAHAPHAPCKLAGWTDCDGRHLYVVCPGEEWWCVDGRASNCGKPSDTAHRCWIRHGDPARGTLDVDKNGTTCDAGAGSIRLGSYHGFVRGFSLVKTP